MPTINSGVEVQLWGQDVGAVAWDDERGYATFRYRPSFIATNLDVSPFMMPLNDELYYFTDLQDRPYLGLPGLLADALPDRFGNALINGWFARRGFSPSDFSPIDRLCYVGRRAMGALEFVPPEHPDLEKSIEIALTELVDVASRIVANHEAFETAFAEDEETVMNLLSVGTSAGGARAKALIAINEETKEIRSGQVAAPDGFDYWLFKFDGVADDQSLEETSNEGRMEFAYYLMARDAGIDMMESRPFEENGRFHFMTKRFDRGPSGDKIHVQTLAALNHFPWAEPGYVGYEQLFQTVRALEIGMPAVEQCFRRMAFNILARNHDDHAKNHGFLMDRLGNWTLAPAYDLTYSYEPGGRFTNVHQMSLAGKRDDFSKDDLIALGSKNDLKKPNIIFEEVESAIENWQHHANKADIPAELTKAIGGLFRRLS
ncbi:MAG: type II toxin-antitoxin system HipA family toxin [Rhodospirillaceae bacterium]|nr:type II toxin-antitoxin system HipA family toxin [Rhodospirillaceae bacterium]